MKLYLVQHGKAAAKEVDAERALTTEGQQDAQKVAAFIERLNLSVDCLWHSGKKRAAQTAEILAKVLDARKGTKVRDGLGPMDDVTATRDELVSSERDIMIVGHLPFLSRLAALLLTGSESANTVAFKNTGIVCLSRSEEIAWQIEWVVTPELLV